jgi:hypothetical protein
MPEKPSDKAPWPRSEEELVAYIREMADWPNGASEPGEGYGRCVYAVAFAATATFNYMAHVLGITGFQGGCADLEILRQTRSLKHGFMILDAENLLYPQYDLMSKVAEWIEKNRAELATVAREKLESDRNRAHPDVVRHWEEMAGGPTAPAQGATT